MCGRHVSGEDQTCSPVRFLATSPLEPPLYHASHGFSLRLQHHGVGKKYGIAPGCQWGNMVGRLAATALLLLQQTEPDFAVMSKLKKQSRFACVLELHAL